MKLNTWTENERLIISLKIYFETNAKGAQPKVLLWRPQANAAIIYISYQSRNVFITTSLFVASKIFLVSKEY